MSDSSLAQGGRKIYLENIPREEALSRLLEKVGDFRLGEEEIATTEALGRVTARAAYARISSPHFHAAAMDGYALASAETAGATPVSPKEFLLDEEAHPLDTGDPMPEGMDCVVMIEHVHETRPGAIRIEAALSPWQNVRVAGEDVVEGQLILTAGHSLRPYDLGALLAAGITRVSVRRRPRIAIIPTGDELVEAGADLKPGDLVEFNSSVMSAFITEWGGEALPDPILEDKFSAIEEAVRGALESADVVLVNAGSSAGREDHTAAVVEKLGELLVHGVAIFPGKPTILGVCKSKSGERKPVLGIPGYPVSAVLALQEFVRPLMAHMAGAAPGEEERIQAFMSRKSASRLGMEEFLRVKLGRVSERMVCLPAKRGASVISSLVEADGVVRVPAHSEGIETGEEVTVELLRPLADIRGNLLMAGSHDNALDLLAEELKKRHHDTRLSASAVGSLAGLIAVRDGEAHIAGSHLLDPETGEYNWYYIQRYLKGREVVVVNFVQREQGILTPKGNPKNIGGIADLGREDLAIVNRQSGAGTRVLLDHLMERAGLSPEEVRGYERVETTHMAVAMAVAAGRADCGLGIFAAANMLGLDFIPLERERFDFIVPGEHWETPAIQKVVDILRDATFKDAVEALGGYNTELTGQMMAAPPREG